MKIVNALSISFPVPTADCSWLMTNCSRIDLQVTRGHRGRIGVKGSIVCERSGSEATRSASRTDGGTRDRLRAEWQQLRRHRGGIWKLRANTCVGQSAERRVQLEAGGRERWPGKWPRFFRLPLLRPTPLLLDTPREGKLWEFRRIYLPNTTRPLTKSARL